jgi:HAD superfamily hydrolase (TIGR01509 family)
MGHHGSVRPLALFDLDDTLIDREDVFRRWATAFVLERGLGAGAVDWFCAADGLGYAPRHELFARARAELGVAEPVQELVDDYRRTYPTFFAPEPPVLAALDTLRTDGWGVAVITNGPQLQHVKLARADLTARVDAVCISAEIGVTKPDPRIFRVAVERADPGPRPEGRTGQRIVMVGDNAVNDIGGAAALGFATIWMHRGRQWDEEGFVPDAIAGSIPEAVSVLLAGGPRTAPR